MLAWEDATRQVTENAGANILHVRVTENRPIGKTHGAILEPVDVPVVGESGSSGEPVLHSMYDNAVHAVTGKRIDLTDVVCRSTCLRCKFHDPEI